MRPRLLGVRSLRPASVSRPSLPPSTLPTSRVCRSPSIRRSLSKPMPNVLTTSLSSKRVVESFQSPDHHLPQKHGTSPGKGRTPPRTVTSRRALGEGERSLTSQFKIPYGLRNSLKLVSVSSCYWCPFCPNKLDKAFSLSPGSANILLRFNSGIIAGFTVFTTQRVLLPRHWWFDVTKEFEDRSCRGATDDSSADFTREWGMSGLAGSTDSCRQPGFTTRSMSSMGPTPTTPRRRSPPRRHSRTACRRRLSPGPRRARSPSCRSSVGATDTSRTDSLCMSNWHETCSGMCSISVPV